MNWGITKAPLPRVVPSLAPPSKITSAEPQGVTYEQATQISNREAQELLGKGKRQTPSPVVSIDFATVDVNRQQKGVTLALLWQEGLDRQQ